MTRSLFIVGANGTYSAGFYNERPFVQRSNPAQLLADLETDLRDMPYEPLEAYVVGDFLKPDQRALRDAIELYNQDPRTLARLADSVHITGIWKPFHQIPSLIRRWHAHAASRSLPRHSIANLVRTLERGYQ